VDPQDSPDYEPPAAPDKTTGLVGKTEPRLWTPPLRPLTRDTTRGFEVIDFAELIGEPLLPWQQWLVKHALELNPDGTYRFRTVLVLVARQNGKSSVKRIVSLWRLYLDGARLVLGTAQDLNLAREQWNMAQETIHASPDLEAEWDVVRRVNGDEWFRAAGGRYLIRASNRRAGRGLSVDELNIDELREQQNWDAWSALSKTTMARRLGQTWAMSNAGDDKSIVLNQLRDSALASRDPSLGLFEWSAEDDCPLDDPDGIAQANPGLGYTVSEAAIRSALGTDPETIYRTEVLCQHVDQLKGAVNLAFWKACSQPSIELPASRRIACFELSEDGNHATLAIAAIGPDGNATVRIRKAWRSSDQAREELPAILATLKPAALAWFPTGPAGAFAATLRPAKKGDKLKVTSNGRTVRIQTVELAGGKVAEACMGLADLARAKGINHPNDPLLNAHITAAQKKPAADGWRFERRGVGHVDAALAAAGAIHVALTLPTARKPRARAVA
jgi:hypothetical protein